MNQCVRDADAASESLSKLICGLTWMDYEHVDLLAKFAGESPKYDIDELSLYNKLEDALELIWGVKHFLDIMIHEHIRSGRGRPKIPYLNPTVDLMRLWTKLTGRRVVVPKGRILGRDGEEESAQPSTEFIRLCLCMIDPNIKLAHVETCIKNGFKLEQEMTKRFGANASKDALGTSRLISILIAEEEDKLSIESDLAAEEKDQASKEIPES